MDLANMISDVAASQYKKECLSNKCHVTINMHNRYSHEIEVIPLTHHIILKYKTLEFKIQRQNKQEYENSIEFLLDELQDAVALSLSDDIEYGGYWPENDEYYNENDVVVKKNEQRVFYKPFREEHFTETVGKYLKSLRLLN